MWNTAFRFLLYDKTKLTGILCGIVISIFLIGAQLGFLDSILDQCLGITKGNEEYIYVVDQKTTSSSSLVNIDKRVGYELQSIPGVAHVYPVIVTAGTCKFKSGATGAATIIGVQSPAMAGAPREYNPGSAIHEGEIIVDADDLENMENVQMDDQLTINDIKVKISGISLNNAGLGMMNIITTIDCARRLSKFSPNHVSAYLIKSNTPDTLLQRSIVNAINHAIPTVKAYTGKDFAFTSIEYIKKASGIVANFMLMVGFSLVTGLIIVGLTMFSAINDRIRDYGTIKAIGGGNRLIAWFIFQQAVLYAVIGFLLSMGTLYGLQALMAMAHKPIVYSSGTILFLFISTLVISLAGSLFSMRKIIKLEPVQIFRM